MHLFKNLSLIYKVLLILSYFIFYTAVVSHAKELPLQIIKLPPGFKIHIFADNVPNARSLSISPSGVVYVGNRSKDKVYALKDTNGDFIADKKYVIAQGLRAPNGIAFYKNNLFVAEINRVIVFENIENNLAKPPKPKIVNNTFPGISHHGWKFIAFGPDDKLYVPIGAPCNVCEREDKRFASILRMNPDGSQLEIFAQGVRNTIGFDWHPKTNELWFTDNGRDNLGDDLPPDELNHAPKKDMHFGFPFCHGKNISDPEHGKKRSCSDLTPAKQELGAHVASLGMRFYTGKMFPKKYRNQIFIAEHGSWNRSTKSGYQISIVNLDKNGNILSYKPFATGWLQPGEKVWGRPVDMEIMKDGSLLLSDDFAGVIYRITYEP